MALQPESSRLGLGKLKKGGEGTLKLWWLVGPSMKQGSLIALISPHKLLEYGTFEGCH